MMAIDILYPLCYNVWRFSPLLSALITLLILHSKVYFVERDVSGLCNEKSLKISKKQSEAEISKKNNTMVLFHCLLLFF
jgi:hypothetical protein